MFWTRDRAALQGPQLSHTVSAVRQMGGVRYVQRTSSSDVGRQCPDGWDPTVPRLLTKIRNGDYHEGYYFRTDQLVVFGSRVGWP